MAAHVSPRAPSAEVVLVNAGVAASIRELRGELERVHLERKKADQKAVSLHLLLQRTATKLFKVTDQCNEAQRTVDDYKQKVSKLHDDLESSKQSYEKMIEDLTVHVCNLTEKLAAKDAQLPLGSH
uniref:Protein phosphatase 1 regulatory subunit 21 C-terminal domain-containing protein n=1 Tax=Lotharella globosa TaxID=91324 RepID=A0A7S3Z6B4_9EUKA